MSEIASQSFISQNKNPATHIFAHLLTVHSILTEIQCHTSAQTPRKHRGWVFDLFNRKAKGAYEFGFCFKDSGPHIFWVKTWTSTLTPSPLESQPVFEWDKNWSWNHCSIEHVVTCRSGKSKVFVLFYTCSLKQLIFYNLLLSRLVFQREKCTNDTQPNTM